MNPYIFSGPSPKYEDLNDSSCREVSIKLHYPEFHEYLMTHFPDDLTFPERLYWFYKGITERPVCKACGNKTEFMSFLRGYREFCSYKCVGSSDEVLKRKQDTSIRKYGVANAMKSDAIKKKLEKTMMAKYGVANPFANKDIKEKIRAKNRANLGVDYPMQSKAVLQKSSQTTQEKYGVMWTCQLKEVYSAASNNSKPNREFERMLKERGIEFEREFPISSYKYDFRVGNTLIEINPSGTHNSTRGIRNREPKSRNYHHDKMIAATKAGYELICVWDWDDKERILNRFCTSPVKIGARECTITSPDIKEAKQFLSKYHIQGTCTGQKVILALEYDGEIIELMTFGKPRYNKNYQWELLRLCTNPKYIIAGGTKRLFNYFVNNYKPESIISYCDLSKFSGTVYRALGFTQIDVNISLHWYKHNKHITNNLLLKCGFDRLFGTNYGKGTSNVDLMKEHGFVEVYDCGQATYVWTLKNVNPQQNFSIL